MDSENEEDVANMKNPFSGLLGSMLECTVCKHANESRQTSFTCLTLSLMDEYRSPRNGFRNMTPSVKLMDRIKAFETAESIDGYRCMVCECRGIMAEIKEILTTLQSPNTNHSSAPIHKLNDIQLVVLQEQYQEVQWELNKLMPPHQKTQNGLSSMNGLSHNGMNGYQSYPSMNGMNGINRMNGHQSNDHSKHSVHSLSPKSPNSMTNGHLNGYHIVSPSSNGNHSNQSMSMY